MKHYLSLAVIATVLTSFTANAAQSSLETDYLSLKNWLSKEYNIDYSLTYSLMGQRTSPSGKNNAVQSYLYPSVAWTTFDNNYGTGILNFSYNSIYYGGHAAENLESNSGFVTPINDFNAKEQSFAGLYYTYQFPREYNWLTLGAGQYNLYMFDGMDYDGNQLYIGLTLFSTVGLRQTVHEDEFHITTFFRVRFAREASYLVHW